MIKKIFLSTFVLLFSCILFAQENDAVQMADTMRSNGRIYVVVAVILAIFAGIILYLVRLDRKISKVENQILKSK